MGYTFLKKYISTRKPKQRAGWIYGEERFWLRLPQPNRKEH